MNLHLMLDEKIVPRVISYFEEALPNGNKFMITMGKNTTSKFVLEEVPNVYKRRFGSVDFWNTVGDVEQYDYILLHSLNIYSIKFISKIKHPRIVWCVWGADLFGGYLAPRGYKLFYNNKEFKEFSINPKTIYQKTREKIIDFLYHNKCKRIKTLKKISYIATLDEELQLLKDYYPEAEHIKKKELFYYPVDDIVKMDDSFSDLGDSIIIGNSASLYGNHDEVFSQLTGIDLKDRKIIVPLSYGNVKYRDYLIRLGNGTFGNAFTPLMEFLPLNKYNEIMRSARTYIYGNYRQEGFGNIVTALCWGGAVFLHPNNILLPYFRRIGCTIFSTEELSDKIHCCLSDDEKTNNRRIILSKYNKDQLISIIKSNYGPIE